MHRLYPTLLGSRWEDVAGAVKRLHDRDGETAAAGTFRIDHGKRLGVRFVVRLLKLPRESVASPVRLFVERNDEIETWRRLIGDRDLATTQSATADGMLAERIGPVELHFRLDVDDGGLAFVQTAAAIRMGRLRLPLPRWLSPSIDAREGAGARSDEVRVSVSLAAPWLGCLVSYSGTIAVLGAPS